MPVLTHPFEPVYDARSRVLILGSFPSPKSRERGFYYAHPQNAFWKTLALVLDKPEPAASNAARREFLIDNRIAVWDVIHSCELRGARDDSIKNPVVNDFSLIFDAAKLTALFTTGKKATELFNSLAPPKLCVKSYYLPSTSPANRSRWGTPEFIAAWSAVRSALEA